MFTNLAIQRGPYIVAMLVYQRVVGPTAERGDNCHPQTRGVRGARSPPWK